MNNIDKIDAVLSGFSVDKYNKSWHLVKFGDIEIKVNGAKNVNKIKSIIQDALFQALEPEIEAETINYDFGIDYNMVRPELPLHEDQEKINALEEIKGRELTKKELDVIAKVFCKEEAKVVEVEKTELLLPKTLADAFGLRKQQQQPMFTKEDKELTIMDMFESFCEMGLYTDEIDNPMLRSLNDKAHQMYA